MYYAIEGPRVGGRAGAAGGGGVKFGGAPPPPPGLFFIGGFARAFVNQTSRPAGFSAGPVTGTGSYFFAPTNSQAQPPEGDLIAPAAGPLGGLSAAAVTQTLGNAEATAHTPPPGARLPLGPKPPLVVR